MVRAAAEPVFVSRQTAAERLEISVDTFDTWLRAGFIPAAHIDRGQITRWHWPSLEEHFLEQQGIATIRDPSVEGARRIMARRQPYTDPFMEGLKNIRETRRKRKGADE